MLRRALTPITLVTLVSVPGFLLGQRLQQPDTSVFMLAVLLAAVVLLAGAIMHEQR